MAGLNTVGDYMVRNPVCAYHWQPISFIRQAMLANSFSYLPVLLPTDDTLTWHMVSDEAIAKYLRAGGRRNDRLASTLRESLDSGQIKLEAAQTCHADTPVEEALKLMKGPRSSYAGVEVKVIYLESSPPSTSSRFRH